MYETRKNFERLLTRQVQDALPFLFGKAIYAAFADLIRYGQSIINFGDAVGVQVYQMIFMEIFGLKVDQVFVTSWLKKHEIEEVKLE